MVDKLDKVGPALDALVAAGSNQIDGPSFSIADPKPLLAKAREEAVKDATAGRKPLPLHPVLRSARSSRSARAAVMRRRSRCTGWR